MKEDRHLNVYDTVCKMLERTLRNIAHNVQKYFHQDMSWDRASSPISASAGHGERGTNSAFHTDTATLLVTSNPNQNLPFSKILTKFSMIPTSATKYLSF